MAAHNRLDLKTVQESAYYAAHARHELWQQATTGTQSAKSWYEWQQIAAQPNSKLTLQRAWELFLGQPRVAAMLAYGAHPGNVDLDPLEIEALQTNPVAYATYHQLRAVCGDVVVTSDGAHLKASDDSLAAQNAFLKKAAKHIADLPGNHQIVTVTI